MKNKELSIREARKRDIISCFFSLLKENPTEKIEDIFKKVEKMPAPQYYVSVENARRYVSMIARNKQLPFTNSNKKEMYFAIYRLWQKACNKKGIEPLQPRGYANVSIITETFLEQQAPCFYLNIETIKGIVYRKLRRK